MPDDRDDGVAPTHDDKCERCGECLGCAWKLTTRRWQWTWCIVRDGPRQRHRWPLDPPADE